MTLFKGQMEEATMGTHEYPLWGRAGKELHCLRRFAGIIHAATWQHSKCHGKSDRLCSQRNQCSQCQRLQLRHCHWVWVKADSCKNIPWTYCSLQGLSLKASFWLGLEEITDSLFPAWGAKWKAADITAASFSFSDPRVETKASCFPRHTHQLGGQPSHLP